MKQPWTWIVSQIHAQNTIHSWYFLFSFCPMMSFVQKKKTTTTTKQKNKKVKERLVSKQNTHSFCFFVTFLFGILQHFFIFGFLGIKVQQPLLSCTVYTTIIRFWLQIIEIVLHSFLIIRNAHGVKREGCRMPGERASNIRHDITHQQKKTSFILTSLSNSSSLLWASAFCFSNSWYFTLVFSSSVCRFCTQIKNR